MEDYGVVYSLFSGLVYSIISAIIDSFKKNKNLFMKDTETLYMIKDAGEVLRSLFGIIYVPALLLFLSKYDMPSWFIVFVLVATSVVVLLVEIKIYCCKKEIRKKECEK